MTIWPLLCGWFSSSYPFAKSAMVVIDATRAKAILNPDFTCSSAGRLSRVNFIGEYFYRNRTVPSRTFGS
jgi:hypothetical protein